MTLALAFNQDHLRVHLTPAQRVLALSSDVVIPYSTIGSADVVAPPWPGVWDFRVGAHVPYLVAKGRFYKWGKGPRRFLWFDRRAGTVLRLRLRDHPAFDEILVAVRDPDGALRTLDERRR